MPDNEVTIELEPSRTVQVRGKQYLLYADDCQTIDLPVSKIAATLEHGQTVESVTIPEWIARDRGLLEDEETVSRVSLKEDDDAGSVTRHDWFVGCALIGLLANGGDVNQAVWKARKIADRATA